MTHVVSLKFQGGREKSLEILYNVHVMYRTGVQEFIFSQRGLRHARILETRKLQLTVKNVVHKGADFYVQML